MHLCTAIFPSSVLCTPILIHLSTFTQELCSILHLCTGSALTPSSVLCTLYSILPLPYLSTFAQELRSDLHLCTAPFTAPSSFAVRLLLLPGVAVATAVLADAERGHFPLLDFLEEVVRIRHAQAVESRSHVLLATLLDHASIAQPLG